MDSLILRSPNLIFLLFLVLTLPLLASESDTEKAIIYKVVDPGGGVTYTDTPPVDQGGSEVTLLPITAIPTLKRPPESISNQPTHGYFAYTRVELISPKHESMLYYDQAEVIARLALTPSLQVGHQVQFYVDNSPYGGPVAAPSLAIAGLERGAHQISARVVMSEGEMVARTQSVTVHVQRHFKRN